MTDSYYIVTDSTKETILISKNYTKIFDFLIISTNPKLSTINHTGKPRIIDRRKFLKDFFKATNNQNKLFELCNILIGRKDNRRKFISSIDLLKRYDYYTNHKNNLL